MKKKLLLSILTILAILLTSIVCFANNNLGEELKDSGNKTQHTIQNAGQGIKNVASDIGNGIQNAASDMGRGVQDVFNGGNTANNRATTRTTTDGYTATRTAAGGVGTTGMGRTTWIWLIMGIVGIVIIALTWYYVTQNHHSSK